VTFLQRLKDTLWKHTNVEPGSQEEEIILKDKFLTQSAPDSHRKLKKLVAEGSRDLHQMVWMATSMFYNRNLEKEKMKGKQQGVVITALRMASSGSGPNPQTGRPFPVAATPEDKAAFRILPHL
jgi:hypothetical protein